MPSHPQGFSLLHLHCLRDRLPAIAVTIVTLIFLSVTVWAQGKAVWSNQEKPIVEQLQGLRKLDDTARAHTTRDLALQIRQLPVVPNKLKLAGGLASLATEGDFGRDTLQEVTTTLALALQEQPPAGGPGKLDSLYEVKSFW